MDERAWLGRVPAIRRERHYGDRVVRCFVERPRNAYDLLAEAAARHPDGEALVCGPERLNYRVFEDAVARCAAGLAAAGIVAGERVALLLGNGIAFPVVLFAALRLGAIAVPLSTREQTEGLGYMLGHSGAKLLVHDADLADRLPKPPRRRRWRGASRSNRVPRTARCRCSHPRRAAHRRRCTRRTPRSFSTPPAPPDGRKARC